MSVLDVNEPPSSIVSYSRDEIEENSPAGTWVANLTVIDEDFNQTHHCKLLNGTQYFTLVDNNDTIPEIFVSRDDADIDYETEANIWINVECVDSGYPPLAVEHSIDIRVLDVNDPITAIVLTGSLTVREDIPVDTPISDVSVADEDIGQTHTYVVVGEMSFGFTVDNSRRQLVVTRPLVLDFETLDDPHVNVTIAVSDDGYPPSTYNQTFTITVVNINEPPVIVMDTLGVYENASRGDLIAELTSSNPEDGQIIRYRILDVDGFTNFTQFYLLDVENSTYLYLNDSISYESRSSYLVEIEATDDGNPPASSLTLITVDVLRSDPCAVGTADCDENALCYRLSSNESRCECDDGYSGDGRTCSEIDECAAASAPFGVTSVCNYGNCTDEIANYSCTCLPGFTDFDCSREINECASNPCVGGQCVDGVNGYTCVCDEGYTGVACDVDIDDCAAALCGGGTCVDGVDDYKCDCPDYWVGDRCSFPVDVCEQPGLCRQKNCIPKSVNAPVVEKQDVGEDATGPPVALQPITITSVSTNGGEDNSHSGDSPYVCVADDNIVTILLPPGVNASSRSFKTDWERYLLNDLYVNIPADDDGDITNYDVPVSSVYITGVSTQPDGSAAIHFVVMVNDKAVGPYSVIEGLNQNCLNSTSLDHSDLICAAVEKSATAPNHQSPPIPCLDCPKVAPAVGSKNTSSKDIIWPVVSCVLFMVVVVALALLYRSHRAKKNLMLRRAEYSPVGGEVYNEGDHCVDNPLFYDGDDEEGEDYERSDAMSGVANPLFTPDFDDGVGTYNNPAYKRADVDVSHNPMYCDPDKSEDDGVIANPIYQSSTATEAIYDNPNDLGC